MYLLYMYAKLHLTEISGKTWRRDFIPDKSKESNKIIAVQGMKNSHRKLHFRRLLDFISECHNFPEEKKTRMKRNGIKIRVTVVKALKKRKIFSKTLFFSL